MGNRAGIDSVGEQSAHNTLLVVNHHRGGNPVSLEIILVWLEQIGIVAFLILVGHLLKGRRRHQVSRLRYGSEDRLLPDRMEVFRRRQPYSTFQRASHLRKIL